MYFDIKDISHSISCGIDQLLDPLTYKAYMPFETEELPRIIVQRLIQVPQFNQKFKFDLIFDFIKKNTEYLPFLFSYCNKHQLRDKNKEFSENITFPREVSVLEFMTTQKNEFPELVKLIEQLTDKEFYFYFLDSLDCSDYWFKTWNTFQEQYILRLVTDWFIKNNLPFQRQENPGGDSGSMSSSKTTE